MIYHWVKDDTKIYDYILELNLRPLGASDYSYRIFRLTADQKTHKVDIINYLKPHMVPEYLYFLSRNFICFPGFCGDAFNVKIPHNPAATVEQKIIFIQLKIKTLLEPYDIQIISKEQENFL